MGRAPRDFEAGAHYHVHTRGNDGQAIYFGNWSGRLYVRELSRAARRHGLRIFAYCLMLNHHHVVLQVGDDVAGLSRGMCELNGRFARISNWANKRSNHLFGARFTHHLIADEDYLFTACRYVLLNPVRKTGSDPRRWRWSSMRPTVGLEPAPPCVDVDWILGHSGRTRREAVAEFTAFVDAGRGVPLRPSDGARHRRGPSRE